MTRRSRIDLFTPAEVAIREAMIAVEALPADTRLTNAVVLLSQAQAQLADYVDEQLIQACRVALTASRTPVLSSGKTPPCRHEIGTRSVRDDGRVVCACGYSWPVHVAGTLSECGHPSIHRVTSAWGIEVCKVCTSVLRRPDAVKGP